MASVLRVALTGGIATGKSHCLARFASLGVPVVDADDLAHEAVAPGSVGLAAVVARFGAGVLDGHGALDRPRLGRIVFADAAARTDLEAIVHPAVYAAVNDWFDRLTAAAGSAPFAVAAIPLLFETERQFAFDRVVVTYCSPDEQLARLVARGKMSAAEAQQRIDAQLPTDVKKRLAHYVIDTSGTFEDTDRQIIETWQEIGAQAVLMRQWDRDETGQ